MTGTQNHIVAKNKGTFEGINKTSCYFIIEH
jgi:hypothetical protein